MRKGCLWHHTANRVKCVRVTGCHVPVTCMSESWRDVIFRSLQCECASHSAGMYTSALLRLPAFRRYFNQPGTAKHGGVPYKRNCHFFCWRELRSDFERNNSFVSWPAGLLCSITNFKMSRQSYFTVDEALAKVLQDMDVEGFGDSLRVRARRGIWPERKCSTRKQRCNFWWRRGQCRTNRNQCCWNYGDLFWWLIFPGASVGWCGNSSSNISSCASDSCVWMPRWVPQTIFVSSNCGEQVEFYGDGEGEGAERIQSYGDLLKLEDIQLK